MNRVTQNLVLTLLGCAVLRISAFSTTYLNYVKPGFRPFLIGAGAVLVILGLIGLFQASRAGGTPANEDPRDDTHERPDGHGRPVTHEHPHDHDRAGTSEHGPGDGDGDGHDHAHGGPRVAWLLCLPVFAIFLIAPPALGSFAASRDDTPPPRDQTLSSFTPLTGTGAVEMTLGDFIGRAWDDDKKSLTGREVKLTGFVSPAKKKGQWYVTRMQIACCAADAFPLKVAVRGLQEPPADTWVEVTGTWIPQTFGTMTTGVVYPQITGKSLIRIDPPEEQYE
ncbi:TIGR03943 family putative permease subunit [Streptosporangium sp. NPDC002721]|uniref:TIGR03943 family putative permease subunit n=1 Tax=Streptosporangium sp. NPDC002721 TaxID=3366188 RepID=UPI0036776F9E